jgi:Lipocalin-like domain
MSPVPPFPYDGHMCITIMRPERPKFFTASPYGGTDEERSAAYAGYLNYCGSYHIDDEKGTVTYRVEVSLFPNWVGTKRIVFLAASSNQLTSNGGGQATSWKRMR